MEKNKVLKAIISASAAAVMFSALPVSAQTSAPSAGMSGAAGATATGSALSSADKKAIMDMGMANMAEVEAGKMAVTKSQSADVKAFAQQMIDDHSKALTEVQALAQAKGVTLPTELDAKHKAMAAKLDKLSGDKFDKEYMKNAGVADHKTVHAKLVKDEKGAKDADVKALAGKMKPTVEQHLKSAEMITAKK
jgi:putative membrane protein